MEQLRLSCNDLPEQNHQQRLLSAQKLLQASGTSGKFQHFYLIFAIINTTLSNALIIGLAFLQLIPELSCLSQKNKSIQYIPCTKQQACSRNHSQIFQNKTFMSFKVNEKTHQAPNFITQFNMYCSTPQEIGFIASSYFIGFIASSLIFPTLADQIGRVRVIIIGALIHIVAMISLIFFAQNLYHLYIVLMLIGIRTACNSQVSFVYLSEVTDNKSRSYFAGLASIGEGIFTVLIGLYYMLGAYYLYMCWICIFISSIIALTAWKYLPQSPIFISQKEGLKNRALNEFRIIAKINGRLSEFNESYCGEETNPLVVSHQKKQEIQVTSSLIYSWSQLIQNMMFICINWFGCIFTAYGIGLDVKYFHESIQTSYILITSGELLSCFMFGIMIKYVGRIHSFLISGGLLILIALSVQYLSDSDIIFSQDIDFFLISCGYLTIKYFNGIMFTLMYLITSQLFESKIKSTAIGVANFFGRFGGLLAPIIVEFQRGSFMNTIAIVNIIQLGFFLCLLYKLKDRDVLKT